jgi:hypothetical protein
MTSRYDELNRLGALARQRAYRTLADRHPDEFQHLLIVERALVGLRPTPHSTRRRRR